MARRMFKDLTFYSSDARSKVKDAIQEIERQTSAEVVVSVRRLSGRYRDIDLAVGAVVAFAALLVLLFHDTEFATEMMPVDVLVSFAIGAVVTAHLDPLRRLLARRSRLTHEASRAARAAFVELGIGRTTERMGILVFVSLFEREVVVVPDVGLNPKMLGKPWAEAQLRLEGTLREGVDFAGFLAALKAIGPVLGAAIPHTAGKVNELPDEVNE